MNKWTARARRATAARHRGRMNRIYGEGWRHPRRDCKEHLGSAGAYMKIFEVNKDHLIDPDKIKPWQVLHLP
jgi:nucleoid-associated protein YgaU